MANDRAFRISREIGIDAGHRVPFHGSKCRSIHGHRYVVQAMCHGLLRPNGPQQDMVLDFGFLKEEMMNVIHAECDHRLILWARDPLLDSLGAGGFFSTDVEETRKQVAEKSYAHLDWVGGALYLIDAIPTAESLARHWYDRLQPRVSIRSEGTAHLNQIRVWETPNCRADFSG
jgi:6-pyruvoyltetrahydropterin/6-carboxytetrahydropterin synthase